MRVTKYMDIEIRNIGGIRRGTAEIDGDINTIQASNWQGKSSFVQAVRTAFGTAKTLTDGETEGRVALQGDKGEWEVRLVKEGETVVKHGTPVLTDEYDQLLVDLFAFLGEDNEVRDAVRNNRDLKEILTKPLQLENIDERIRELTHERETVETELERAEERAQELVGLKQLKTDIESELEELCDRKTAMEASGDPETQEELSDLRAERERVIDLIERLEKTLERSQEKLQDAYDEHKDIEVDDPQDVQSEHAEVRENYERTKQDKELLQSIYSANKRLLEEDRLELLEEVNHGLLEDSHICWLCGGETNLEEMSDKLDELGEKVLDLRNEVRSYEDRIENLEAKRSEIKQQRRRRDELESRISELESTITEREESLSSARERLESIESQLEDLSEQAEAADEKLSDVQSEIKYKEAELEDVEKDIEAANAAADQVETLEAELDQITAEIRELRTRKGKLQDQIRTEFDETIRDVVQLFETSFETARLTSEFDLVVARDGREVSLDALSEGEVELLGLVVAIAGFEAYDVAEQTPIILLDRLGGLADNNLSILADYLKDRTESLLLTVYPENSTLGNNRIDPTDWDVIPPVRSLGQ